jgi:glycosyltransferase
MNISEKMPIVTIITIVSNNVKTIRNAIQSVAFQDYPNIEHIVIDNASKDGTLEAIYEQKDVISLIVSEPDDGIYFALNKGIRLSKGEIIGFLNSDDILKSRNTISKIVSALKDSNFDAVYGDLQYFSMKKPNQITRLWNTGEFSLKKIKKGWMPPHPTFYTYKKTYTDFGFFDESYKISSDYEMMLRLFYCHRIRAKYLPEVLVKMQRGGVSNQNFKSIFLKTREDLRIMKKYKFNISSLILKNISKFSQFIFRG